jgi:hypothetical protein
MSKNIARKLSLALTLLLLTASTGRAFAQTDVPCSTDPNADPNTPCVVTSGDPEPQVVTSGDPEPQIVVGNLTLIKLLHLS